MCALAAPQFKIASLSPVAQAEEADQDSIMAVRAEKVAALLVDSEMTASVRVLRMATPVAAAAEEEARKLRAGNAAPPEKRAINTLCREFLEWLER
jgi:hypothetical protein